MATAVSTYSTPRSKNSTVRHQLRVLRVIAGAEFKLKYSGSALGYFWSVLRPLALFLMLYVVFGRVFHLGTYSRYYPLSLLLAIVFFNFFADATVLGMNSLVARGSLLRKMSFPRLIIPMAATLTGALTFLINLTVIAGFIVYNRIVPRPNWVLMAPLMLELYLLSLGVALILATVYVRLRDIGQVWELALQLLFYASAIIFPIGYLPPWARSISFLNPFVQIIEDARAIILYDDLPQNRVTVTQAFHSSAGRLAPIAITLFILAAGLILLKREEPWLAERV
jgi:ABC-2 type transport system permease protein